MRWFRMVIAALLAAALLVACMGDGDDDEATPAATAALSEATATTEVVPASPTASPTPRSTPTTQPATPSPTARATVTAPIRPIATQAPAATATVEGEAEPITLEVVQQGFSEVQSFDEVGYGFVVENPDSRNAVINSEYRVTAYSGGEALEVDSGYLDYVLPGQRVGVGGSIFIPSGRDADSIVVELTAGQAAEPKLDPGFAISAVRFFPKETFPSATGVLSTTSDVPLQDFEVFAVGYDAAGAIIGGGYTFVSFILAGDTTGVEVTVSSAEEPARVELYPVVTSLTIFALDSQSETEALPLAIVDEGYGPSTFPNELGWGFVVENPNATLAAETTAYRVIAYAEDGSVLGVYTSFMSLVLPGERLGLGGSFYVPAGTTAERLDFELLGRYFNETTIEAGVLTASAVGFVPDQFTPKVTGTITSNLDRELNDIEVYAVAYNAAGDIIGGGFTFIDLIEAGGQQPVEVTIAVGQEPSSVELYATVGSLAEIE
jgi:hypothetical protein